MKITSIDAFPLAYPEPHYKGIERYVTLARIETDDGLVGWGECISQFREASIATKLIIEQGFAPLLVGEDPRDVERLWRKLLDARLVVRPRGNCRVCDQRGRRGALGCQGQGTRAAGIPPSWQPIQKRVAAMGSIVFDMEDLDWTLGEFAWMREQGYRIVKGGWGMRPEAVFGQDRDRDLRARAAIRETIGDGPRARRRHARRLGYLGRAHGHPAFPRSRALPAQVDRAAAPAAQPRRPRAAATSRLHGDRHG